MSGSNSSPGLLAAPVVVTSEAVRDHRAATPDVQSDNLGYLGGLIVGTGANLAVNFLPYARYFSAGTKLGFVAAMLLGIALVVTGWRARGQRRIGGAVKAIAVPGIGFYLIATYLPGLLHVWWGQALATGIIVANVVRVAICLSSPVNQARELVVEDINSNDWHW
jgi:hypothetical protein